jgi:hypothetical protein
VSLLPNFSWWDHRHALAETHSTKKLKQSQRILEENNIIEGLEQGDKIQRTKLFLPIKRKAVFSLSAPLHVTV